MFKGSYGKAAVGDPEFNNTGLPHAFAFKADGKLASVAINELCEVLISMGATLQMILDRIGFDDCELMNCAYMTDIELLRKVLEQREPVVFEFYSKVRDLQHKELLQYLLQNGRSKGEPITLEVICLGCKPYLYKLTKLPEGILKTQQFHPTGMVHPSKAPGKENFKKGIATYKKVAS